MYYFTFWQKLITWYQEWGHKHGQYESIRPYLGLKIRINLCLSGDIAENCKQWKQRWTLYVLATGAVEKDKPVQCGILLHMTGEESLDIYNIFVFSQDEVNKIQSLFQKFDQYFAPKKNITYERYLFLNCTQKGCSFDNFLIDIKSKAKTCEKRLYVVLISRKWEKFYLDIVNQC